MPQLALGQYEDRDGGAPEEGPARDLHGDLERGKGNRVTGARVGGNAEGTSVRVAWTSISLDLVGVESVGFLFSKGIMVCLFGERWEMARRLDPL